jgi:YgiT-type zinc finger domain-containing protein
MTCFVCKGTVNKGFSSFTADINGRVVIVRNVPARICDQCGDTCYDTETAKRLEEIVDSLIEQAHAEIAVVGYSERVA